MPYESNTAAGLPTTSTQITLHPVVNENNTFPEIVTSTNQNTFTTLHRSLDNQVQSNTILSYSGWIVAGSLFVILAGVIILLAVLNCILWKRYVFNFYNSIESQRSHINWNKAKITLIPLSPIIASIQTKICQFI